LTFFDGVRMHSVSYLYVLSYIGVTAAPNIFRRALGEAEPIHSISEFSWVKLPRYLYRDIMTAHLCSCPPIFGDMRM